jgi:cation:H+ antiporter
MVNGLLLLAGLALLIQGASLLIKGASGIATRFGISPMIIGLTVVSFGTSMPEFVVSLASGLRSESDLAIGNIIGSNIANVLLVLGIAAIIRPLPVRNSTVVSEIPFSLSAALLLGFLANAHLFSTNPELSISHVDGVILLSFFMLFMIYVYKMSVAKRKRKRTTPQVLPDGGTARSIAFIAIGAFGLYFGGQWVIDGAVGLAQGWGINNALIGLTLIAIGTSSPELVASVMAAYRKQTDMAIGNIIGSNIFNVLWVLGFTSVIVELPFQVLSNMDLMVAIGSSALVILALATSRNSTISRAHGILFVSLYSAYLVYVVMRG